MSDDPRDKRTPRHGVPSGRPVTEPRGNPILPRPVIERGPPSSDRERRRQKLTPAYIKQMLSRRVDAMEHGVTFRENEFATEELTPITTIAVVRQELKDDIKDSRSDVAAMRGDVNAVRNDIGKLIAVVKANNEQWPKLIDKLMAMISAALKTQQDLGITVTERELDIKSSRAKTAAEIEAQREKAVAEIEAQRAEVEAQQKKATTEIAIHSNKEKWSNIGKVVGFIASISGATLIINALMQARC